MPIQVECPSCRSAFRVADGYVGKRWRLRELGPAQGGAHADLRSSWQERRLPDDLPGLIPADVARRDRRAGDSVCRPIPDPY